MKTAFSYVFAAILALTGIGRSSAEAMSAQTQTGAIDSWYQTLADENWNTDYADDDYSPDIELDKTLYSTRDTIKANLLTCSPDTDPVIVEIIWLETGNVVYFNEAREASLTINIDLHPGNYLLRVRKDIDWSTYWDEYWNAGWNENWTEDWKEYWNKNSSSVAFSVTGESDLMSLDGNVDVEMRSETNIVLSARLEWDGLSDGGPYTVVRRDERYQEEQTTYFDGIYDNHFVDENLFAGGVYTYTVSDGKRSSNPIVIDLGGFPPLEYAGNKNNSVIVLKVRDPYMYSAIDKPSAIDGNGLKILDAIDINDRSVTPVIINGRTMIPVASLIKKMGGSVKWDADARVITIKLLDTIKPQYNTLEIPIGSKTVYFNSEGKTFDTPAQIINSRTLVPIRLLELLGCDVEWIADSESVVICYWDGESIGE